MLNEWCMEASGRSFNHPVRAPYKRFNRDAPRRCVAGLGFVASRSLISRLTFIVLVHKLWYYLSHFDLTVFLAMYPFFTYFKIGGIHEQEIT